ncbi:MAG: vanadium-dependent haloperoxidase [Candidatus Dechloromonas phosphoritropha]|nr:vanadium-dependent haloperoxidase [Candidatus Dechloromonas phosphoritropha]MBP8789390.1 vanadium-dependent haloperoxidase [Azonexus sp.]MBP9227386.1 vanadium-dependent haloperoxidase [Azonexus sp.]
MNLILEWNNILLEAIRNVGKLPLASPDRERGGPPQVARSIGIVYTAVYDAWSAYDAVAKPVRRTMPRKPVAQHTEANRRKAISQAAYRALIDQFPPAIYEGGFRPNYETMLTAQLAKDGITIGGSTPAPVDVGNQAADDVLAFRHSDNSNQANLYADTTGYAPMNKPMAVLLPAPVDAIDYPGRWQALTYLNSAHEAKTPKFICPHWGQVKPFALTSGSQFRPTTGPQSPLSQGYLDQAKHVMDIQERLTPEQKVIAEYWADGPNSELPPGHWTEFAAFVVARDGLDLNQSVKLYLALANAIFDASIATWDAKKAFDYVRPVTAIRHLFRGRRVLGWAGAGKGTQEILGETWKPFQVPSFPTPPFCEFTSGHSGFSMAAATVLKNFTGSDGFGFFYAQDVPLKADPTEPVTDVVLHWPTFTSAAREAGESRLYGGIHFYEGNVVGLDIGEKVGNAAYAKAQDLWSGA